MPLVSRFAPLALSLVTCGLLLVGSTGCTALRSLIALTEVGFALDRVSGVRLAGVQLDRVREYHELSVVDVTRIGSALASGRLPLDLNLHIVADNPEANPEARLLGMEWTLFLHDEETVSGRLDREIRLPPGERTDVAILVELDLIEFFDGSARQLVEVAAGLAGVEGEPLQVRLEVLPSVETPLGPIRYPRPLVLGGTGPSSGSHEIMQQGRR